MPYKDPEERRAYYRQYQRDRYNNDPDFKAYRQERHNRSKEQHGDKWNMTARAKYWSDHEASLAKLKEQREKHRETRREDSSVRNGRIRMAAIEAYGGPRCACCGETTLEFLSIDHINGGGTAHRKITGAGSRFYWWLRKEGYPPGYQVLCYNCNMGKARHGICPHEMI